MLSMTRDKNHAGSPDRFDDEPIQHYPADDHAATPAPSESGHRSVEHHQQQSSYRDSKKVKSSFAGGTWAALIIGALLLILLIVFILQNQQEVEITFFAWTVHFPAAIAYLLSAITGALIMALVGGWRMYELRRQVKKQPFASC